MTSSPLVRAVVCIVVAGVLAGAVGVTAYRTAVSTAMHRRPALVAYLADPERG